MLITISNPGVVPQSVNGLDITIAAGASSSPIDIAPSQLSMLTDLAAKKAAGVLNVTIAPTADEIASGFMSPSKAIEAEDVSPVLITQIDSSSILLWKDIPALGAGVADDAVIFAAGAMPNSLKDKYRIVDAWLSVKTAIALSTVTIQDALGGVGNAQAVLSSAAAGIARATALGAGDASFQVTVGPATVLTARRSDRGVAFELFIMARRER